MNQDHTETNAFERYTELQLFEALESNPETTQADLATRAGVAIGTVNWYLKRWSAKGFVKVKRIGRWRWRYLLTPQGMAEKADLANRYFQASMRIYRQSRAESTRIIQEAHAAGYEAVIIEGDGDIAEICQLTCLELGMERIGASNSDPGVPRIVVEGLEMGVIWPEPDAEEE